MSMKVKLSLVMAFLLTVAACGSHMQPMPVGPGRGAHEMKFSPCACLKIETKPGLPEWYSS